MKLFAYVLVFAVVSTFAASIVRADEQLPEPVTSPDEPRPATAEPLPVVPVLTPAPPTPSPALDALPQLPPLPPLPSSTTPSAERVTSRNFAGSVQLDYLALARGVTPPEKAFAGATVELSLKLAMDLGHNVTASVKVCYACHGFEVGMAYFDLRAFDELNVRVGRFTPAFGNFPVRHDPANHATSDKPLAYDMGRMVRFREWNEGILPAPWVDNGIEINGSHTFGRVQVDYAAYAMSGPKGNASNFDFDFTQSRSGEAYYVDNNSQPIVGARAALNIDLAERRILTLGGSGMTGHYDADAELGFVIAGADATLQIDRTFLRAEYLARWTQFEVGSDPDSRLKFGPRSDGNYEDYFFKDGFDVEVEHPIDRFALIGRFDGLRRRGNSLVGSDLSNDSRVFRYTLGGTVRLVSALVVKASVERYDFDDFVDDTAFHLGVAGPF